MGNTSQADRANKLWMVSSVALCLAQRFVVGIQERKRHDIEPSLSRLKEQIWKVQLRNNFKARSGRTRIW